MKRTLRNAALVLAALISTAAWAETDAGLGTWKLNLKKSSFKAGTAPKQALLSFEASGKGVKSRQEWVSASGDKTEAEYTANYDGKDYRVKGSAAVDSIALKMRDARTVDRWDKKDGKVVQYFTRRVSADGKTMMVTHKATAPDGKPFENVMLFEKE
jgi:hypothetical protein